MRRYGECSLGPQGCRRGGSRAVRFVAVEVSDGRVFDRVVQAFVVTAPEERDRSDCFSNRPIAGFKLGSRQSWD